MIKRGSKTNAPGAAQGNAAVLNGMDIPMVQDQGLKPYDYHDYIMTSRDRVIAFLIGGALAAVVLHIFFGSIIVDIAGIAIAGVVAQKVYRKAMIGRVRNKLIMQFRDMLDSVTSSVSAGKVTQAAFVDAEKDMRVQYGEDSYIYRELRIINIGVANGGIIEEILMDFGRRSGIEDIESFANVFMIANRRGGNIKSILTETKSILCDKIEIEQEIATMVGATKNQLNIMMIMPLIIVPMSSSFTEGADNGVQNILVKLVALGAFILAYVIGRKITNIKM